MVSSRCRSHPPNVLTRHQARFTFFLISLSLYFQLPAKYILLLPNALNRMTAPRPAATGAAAATAAAADWGESDDSDAEQVPGANEPVPDFYDPDADDIDDRWAVRQRKGRQSDAVLSCPGCFTTVCLDCQQHELYAHQFRAMFVRNCVVDTSAPVPLPPAASSGAGARRGKRSAPGADATIEEEEAAAAAAAGAATAGAGAAAGGGGAAGAGAGAQPCGEEVCFPVTCEECGVEVGVRDGGGVYHLFHVLATN